MSKIFECLKCGRIFASSIALQCTCGSNAVREKEKKVKSCPKWGMKSKFRCLECHEIGCLERLK